MLPFCLLLLSVVSSIAVDNRQAVRLPHSILRLALHSLVCVHVFLSRLLLLHLMPILAFLSHHLPLLASLSFPLSSIHLIFSPLSLWFVCCCSLSQYSLSVCLSESFDTVLHTFMRGAHTLLPLLFDCLRPNICPIVLCIEAGLSLCPFCSAPRVFASRFVCAAATCSHHDNV